MMNNYLDVLFDIVDNNFDYKSEEEKKELKEILKKIVIIEKEYEFFDDRPRVKNTLESNI